MANLALGAPRVFPASIATVEGPSSRILISLPRDTRPASIRCM